MPIRQHASFDPEHASGGRVAARQVEAHPLQGSPRLVAQRARIDAAFGPALQLHGPPQDEAPVQAVAGGLPSGLRAGIESLSGMDMSAVRVHRNSAQPAQLNALAYAQGNDIHLGPGQEQHLPHEAWHVVQQAQGRVPATRQLKEGVAVNDDAGLEHEADVMGARALAIPPASGQAPLQARPAPASATAPVQGRFGFEVELPMLFLNKADHDDVPSADGGPDLDMDDLPEDAAHRAGATDLLNGPECHINVDHSKTLNPLFVAELLQYAADEGLDANDTQSLLDFKDALMPHGASIVEVVTDAWDENALTRTQALQKIRAVIAAVTNLFNDVNGHQQAALGPYFIGSSSPEADAFQPRLGYFHATYGIKLSQVPRLFEETTRQKKRLEKYVKTNKPQGEHARNVRQTYHSVGAAKTALKGIKAAWPRVGKSKGWTAGAEPIFLGYLTLLANYLLMFKANNGANLAKQMVGMHYYKSDLYDVAGQLPTEIITTLRADPVLLTATIAAIGAATGYAAGDELGGPLDEMTLTEYLEQILTGNRGVLRQHQGAPLHDDLLEGSINPYSHKLGPDLIGPGGNQEQGVVMENRHLEYLDPRYGDLTDASEASNRQDAALYGLPFGAVDARTDHEKAMFDSIGAREEGPARRPIGEWEAIMIGIYDMITAINRR
jgi:hypothetical protein